MTCKFFQYTCNKKYMQGMVGRHDGIGYLLKVFFFGSYCKLLLN